MHHTTGDCSVSSSAFQNEVHENRKLFFPKSFEHLKKLQEFKSPRKFKPNGGWGDHRDQNMCLLFSKTTDTSQLMQKRADLSSDSADAI